MTQEWRCLLKQHVINDRDKKTRARARGVVSKSQGRERRGDEREGHLRRGSLESVCRDLDLKSMNLQKIILCCQLLDFEEGERCV